jgi:uncharacterized protein YjeT (DUF2065 family)
MQTVGYWEAWFTWWWQGKSLQGAQMWGLPMLTWGRIGKIVQFVGGLATVIDIVGPERIAEWGKRLRERSIHHEKRTFADSWQRRKDTRRELRDYELTTLAQRRARSAYHREHDSDPGDQLFYAMYPEMVPEDDSVERHEHLSEDAKRASRFSRWTFPALIIGTILALVSWQPDFLPSPRPWWLIVLFFVVAPIFAAVLQLLFITLTIALPVVVNLFARAWPIAAYYLLVKPMVVVLRSQPDRSLRVIGVLLVVFGFSFDLLAT